MTMITAKCNHEPNENTFQIADGYSTERECVVNVCCKHCGKCGSMAFDLHNATFDDGMMVVADEDRDETEKKTVTLIEKQNWTPETLERLYSDFIDVQDLHSRLLGFLEEIARLENEQSKEDRQENKPEAEEEEEEDDDEDEDEDDDDDDDEDEDDDDDEDEDDDDDVYVGGRRTYLALTVPQVDGGYRELRYYSARDAREARAEVRNDPAMIDGIGPDVIIDVDKE